MQEAIEQSAFEFHRRVQAGEDVIVGVNRYQSGESEPIELLRIEPDAEQRQVDRTRRVRAERDPAAWEAAVAAVRAAAGSDANVLPPMREALRVGATVGELCGVLRDAWGTYDAAPRAVLATRGVRMGRPRRRAMPAPTPLGSGAPRGRRESCPSARGRCA